MQENKKNQKNNPTKNPDDISRNLIIRCLIALPGSVFHIILKLLALSHVTAKLADTMLGYSCCHNSSYLASDVKEDKVLLWACTKLLHIMFLVHKEKERKAAFFLAGQPRCDSKCLSKVFVRSQNHLRLTGYKSHRRGWRGSTRLLQKMQLKIWEGGVSQKKGQRPLGKQTGPLSLKGAADLSCNFMGSTKSRSRSEEVVFPRDCLSQHGCSWKSGLWVWWGDTCLCVCFVSPSTLQGEGFYLWLKHLHLIFFPSSRKKLESQPYHTDGFPLN